MSEPSLPAPLLRRPDAGQAPVEPAAKPDLHESKAPAPAPQAVAVPSAQVATTASAPGSAGALLRAARQAQGLHIGALAVTLKVPVKKLEALEADQHDAFADAVFERALAGSVCRALHCDPEPVLAALPQATAAGLQADLQGLKTAFHDAPQARHLQTNRPLWWGVGALAVAITAVLLWPRNPAPSAAPSGAGPSVPAAQPAAAQPIAGVQTPPAGPSAGSSASAPAVAASAAVVFGDAAQNRSETPVQQAQIAPVSVASQASATTPVQRVELLLQVDDTCWVEVQSATGELLIRRSAAAGETLRLAGAAPLAVVLGRADRVRASVGGRSIDLAPYLKDGPVARFEVKP